MGPHLVANARSATIRGSALHNDSETGRKKHTLLVQQPRFEVRLVDFLRRIYRMVVERDVQSFQTIVVEQTRAVVAQICVN